MNKNIINSIPQQDLSLTHHPFSNSTQKLLNWFVFFLAFPAIDLLGSSITFYLFIAIIVKIGSFWTKKFNGKTILFLFLAIVLITSFFAPSMPRHPGFFSSAKLVIQYVYWIFTALFFISQYKRINLLQLSKWVFWATIASVICFYLIKLKLETSAFSIILADTRNGFVFNLLCTIPISFYYIINAWSKKMAILIMPFFLFVMLLTDGRSAAVLIILELLLISAIIYPFILKVTRVFVPVLGFLFFIAQTDVAQMYLDSLADDVESFNPRFANLLRGKDEGDLSFDKSWLIRKVMVDKGIEIFKEYPLIGIGSGNFVFFDSKIATLDQYERLGAEDVEYFNKRSPHNSYIQVLSEFGIIGIVLFLSMLIFPLSFFVRQLFTSEMKIEYLPMVSLFAISMHFYAIAALYGAIAWWIIGLSWAVLNNSKK